MHSAFDKAAVIAGVKFRKLETDEEFSLSGGTLEDAIKVCRDLFSTVINRCVFCLVLVDRRTHKPAFIHSM